MEFPRTPQLLVLHDADCGFCTRCAAYIPRISSGIEVSSIQAADLQALGIDPDRAVAEMPAVTAEGRVAWGHHAWAEILKCGPLPLRLAGHALDSRLLERPASAVYGWVAANRHRLTGGTQACAMPANPATKG
ncbi:thiol-disulfide oxidoreductase DCC family protein [Mariniluteicoccus flavus]